MSLILSGTDGLSDVDGTAATPAIRGTDANTGIFFGTDIIGFSEGGVEAARINADSQFVTAAGTAALPVITTTGDTNTGIFFPAADTIAFSEGGAEAMRIDSSGNVGIGTSSPASKFDVAGTIRSTGINSIASGSGVETSWNGTTGFLLAYNRTTSAYLPLELDGSTVSVVANTTDVTIKAVQSSGNIILNTNSTERARIDGSGNLLVGATATSNGGKFLVAQPTAASQSAVFQSTNATAGNNYGILVSYTAASPNGTSNSFVYCNDSTQLRAEIRSNGGLANFSANNVNLSDKRTKTDIQNAGGYLAKICAIPVRTFKYKDQTDDLLNLGVIAQEVEAVAPELVDVSGFGETPKDGVPLKAIYQTDLQYALMKCIQEQQAIITALTARIETLENKT